MSIGPIDIHEESESFEKNKVDVNETFKGLVKDFQSQKEFYEYNIALKSFEVKTRFKFFRFWKELILIFSFVRKELEIEHVVIYEIKRDNLIFKYSTIENFIGNWKIIRLP